MKDRRGLLVGRGHISMGRKGRCCWKQLWVRALRAKQELAERGVVGKGREMCAWGTAGRPVCGEPQGA